MLELDNQTPYLSEIHPANDIHCRNYVVVVIKGTFNIDPGSQALTPAQDQVEIKHADEYFGEPGKSAIKYASDLALAKTATDVVVNGHAYAPEGRLATQIDTAIELGPIRKTLRVFGDRYWLKRGLGWESSQPEPFDRVALGFENAYGGLSPETETEFYPYNPVGKGYLTDARHAEYGVALPNLEDPAALIREPNDQPHPHSFGVVGRDWLPRIACAGSYDREWEEQRMPLLPLDFDNQFYNCAHENMMAAPFLNGTELVNLVNMTESGHCSFRLPQERFVVEARIRGQANQLISQLDTVVIEPDLSRVALTWRVSIPCGQKLLYLDQVSVRRHG